MGNRGNPNEKNDESYIKFNLNDEKKINDLMKKIHGR